MAIEISVSIEVHDTTPCTHQKKIQSSNKRGRTGDFNLHSSEAVNFSLTIRSLEFVISVLVQKNTQHRTK